MTTINKKGRGRGKTPNQRYSLRAQYPERPSERIIIKVSGRPDNTLEEKHRRLLEMQQWCYKCDVIYRWFLASLQGDERTMYLTIDPPPSVAYSNVKSQVSRLHLICERVAMTPMTEETTAPQVLTEVQEQEREEVQV